jgi:hypothetical protein
MALLLCLVNLALVSVTHACDHHHHHGRLQQQQHNDAPHDHDHKRQRRGLRKGVVTVAKEQEHANANDHHHHHHDEHDADCNEDHSADTGMDTQGGTKAEKASRELFKVTGDGFLRVSDEFEWASEAAFEQGGGRCNTSAPEVAEVLENDAIVTAFRNRFGKSSEGGGYRRRLAVSTIVVPLYFHVLIGNNGKGDLEDDDIRAQITVLEEAFLPDFTFELQKITRTRNDAWFQAGVGSSAERAFKDRLREGGANALNFYTLQPSDGVLGWATLPSSYSRNPTADGVCVNWGSLPNGRIGRYNEGMLLLRSC